MNELIKVNNFSLEVKEYKNQRVITFKEIDMVHERPYGTANKRFLDNKKRFIDGGDYFTVSNSEIRKSHIIPLSDNDYMDKTLVTESGYLMLVKSLSDDLAWDVQRTLVKSYFTKKKTMTTFEHIQILAQGNIELNSRIDGVEHRLEEFKNDMPLLAVEIDRITTTVKKRGVEVLGGFKSNAYNDSSLRSKLYQDIHKDVRRQFGVGTYKAIKRNQCDKAVQIVSRYEPPMCLKEQIDDTNAQISLNE